MWKQLEYSDEYLDEMIDMNRENYGDIEIAHRDFLEWQYFNNPAGKAVIILAQDDETKELAGQYIVIPFDVKVSDKIVRCVNSLDTLTREQYRGQGIFRSLTEANYEMCKEIGYRGVVIFPNENSRPGFYKHFPFRRVCKFPILVSTTFRVHIPKIQDMNYRIKEISETNVSLFDDFWEIVKDKYSNVIGVRNAEYMRWRYLEIPQRLYGFYGIFHKENLVGYVIGTIKNISVLRTGVIVDFLYKDGVSDEIIKVLLNRELRYFKENKAFVSMAYLPQCSQEYKALKRSSFIKWPSCFEPRMFEVSALDFGFNCLTHIDEEQWFTTIGDYLLV